MNDKAVLIKKGDWLIIGLFMCILIITGAYTYDRTIKINNKIDELQHKIDILENQIKAEKKAEQAQTTLCYGCEPRFKKESEV